MPLASEHHSHARNVGGFYYRVVVDRAARLDYRRYACFGGCLYAVGEGKEGVGGHHRAASVPTGLLYRYLHRVDPAGLPTADTHRRQVAGEYYRVGLDMFNSAPRERQVGYLLQGRVAQRGRF